MNVLKIVWFSYSNAFQLVQYQTFTSEFILLDKIKNNYNICKTLNWMECNDEVYTLEIFYTKSKLKYECVEAFWFLNRLNFIFQDRVTVINHILF